MTLVVIAVTVAFGTRYVTDFLRNRNLVKDYDLNLSGYFSNNEKDNHKKTDGDKPKNEPDEESKSNSDSMLKKGMQMMGFQASKLVNKINSSKVEEDDNDPAKYHSLPEDASNPSNGPPAREPKQTRIWTSEGAKMVD